MGGVRRGWAGFGGVWRGSAGFGGTVTPIIRVPLKIDPEKSKNLVETAQSKLTERNVEGFQARASLRTNKVVGLTNFSAIWKYGCWCSFGSNILSGKGEPKDVVDKACRDLTLAMRCVNYDTAESTCSSDCDNSCNVYNINYARPVQRPGETSETSSYTQCSRSNRNSNCNLWTCSIETDFAKKLVNFFFESIKLNPDYMHDYGFDSNYMCESAEGAQNAHGPGNGNAWSNINPLNEEKKKGNWADDAIKTFVKSMNNAKKEEDEVESSLVCTEKSERGHNFSRNNV